MSQHNIALEDGLDLRKVITTGSVLNLNTVYENTELTEEEEKHSGLKVDFIGKPVNSFAELESQMQTVDKEGLVKKKVLEEGGGLKLNTSFTVYLAYSGYWEKDMEPFEVRALDRPLIVDLKENGLLPGLQMAVESMLVGEMSVFLLSYKVMYGLLGVEPRIKAKSDCVFYIKLVKSILTPQEGPLDFGESNMFQRIFHEVKLLYASGVTLHKANNNVAAIQLFRKGVNMLHKCRLANEEEEKKQEKMLKKLYTNLAICYNLTRQPLKACTACNELNRLNSLWNNGKVLFQNAKALRMIGQFDCAEKRLTRAKKLCPDSKDINGEFELLEKTKESCNQAKKMIEQVSSSLQLVSEEFKNHIDTLIRDFKTNVNLCKLELPEGLNSDEIAYIKDACTRENLFFTKIKEDIALDKEDTSNSSEDLIDL